MEHTIRKASSFWSTVTRDLSQSPTGGRGGGGGVARNAFGYTFFKTRFKGVGLRVTIGAGIITNCVPLNPFLTIQAPTYVYTGFRV